MPLEMPLLPDDESNRGEAPSDGTNIEELFPPLEILPYMGTVNFALSLVYLIIGVLLHVGASPRLQSWLLGDLGEAAGAYLRWFFLVFAGSWFVDSIKAYYVAKVAWSPELKKILKGFEHTQSLWHTDNEFNTYVLRTGVAMNGAAPFILGFISGTPHTAIFFMPFWLHAAVGSVCNHFKAGLFKLVHGRLNELVFLMLPGDEHVQKALSASPCEKGSFNSLVKTGKLFDEDNIGPRGKHSLTCPDWPDVTYHTTKLYRQLEALLERKMGGACMIFMPALVSSGVLGIFFGVLACVVKSQLIAFVAFCVACVYSSFALGNLRDMADITSRFASTTIRCSAGAPVLATALHLGGARVKFVNAEYDRFLNMMQLMQPGLKIEGITISNRLIFSLSCVVGSHLPVIIALARAFIH